MSPSRATLVARYAEPVSRELPIRVLGKVDLLLDQLAQSGERSAAELAEILDEPRSSVYRLLLSLRALGMVERSEARGRFRLGLRFLSLAAAVQSRFDERRAALPVMEHLHDLTGETVFLTIRRDFAGVCVERIEGRRVQVLALRVGGSLPLHQGAAPRVLLAWDSPTFWDEYIAAGPLEAATARTITDPAALRAEIETIRQRGYAISDEDVTEGIAALGAPIFDYKGIRAALSVAGVRPAILGDSMDAVLEPLLDGAREISRSLGHAA